MAIFLVRQTQTYDEEKTGEYLWSPQADKGGSRIYERMREIRKGDIILHVIKRGMFVAVSRAASDFFQDKVPTELEKHYGENCDGYRVNTTDHLELNKEFPLLDHKQWFIDHHNSDKDLLKYYE